MSFDAEAAVPALVMCLRDPQDYRIRCEAAMALSHIRKRPELVVPALTQNLSDTNETVRSLTASALAQFRDTPVLRQERQESIEERLFAFQKKMDGNAQRTENSRPRSFQEELAELNRMGLVERAQQDIAARLVNASVEQWTIGYGMDTNIVLCDVQYRLPGDQTTSHWPFLYRRSDGSNWSLVWKPESPYLNERRTRGWVE